MCSKIELVRQNYFIRHPEFFAAHICALLSEKFAAFRKEKYHQDKSTWRRTWEFTSLMSQIENKDNALR